MPVHARVGRAPAVAMMGQAGERHGGQTDAAEREACEVGVHQLARSVFICGLTIHEIQGS